MVWWKSWWQGTGISVLFRGCDRLSPSPALAQANAPLPYHSPSPLVSFHIATREQCLGLQLLSNSFRTKSPFSARWSRPLRFYSILLRPPTPIPLVPPESSVPTPFLISARKHSSVLAEFLLFFRTEFTLTATNNPTLPPPSPQAGQRPLQLPCCHSGLGCGCFVSGLPRVLLMAGERGTDGLETLQRPEPQSSLPLLYG